MTNHYSRRNFIKKTALWTAAGTLPVAGSARAMGTDPVLVTVFLRGAADALNIVVPYGDGDYALQRPGIALKADGYTNLDGFFGLNKVFADHLMPMYQSQELGFIHCAGSKDNSRSHFEAQDYMDAGTPGIRSTRTGWLQRALTALGPTIPHAGISIGKQTNKAFAGPTPTNTMLRRTELRKQRKNIAGDRDTLIEIYNPASHPLLGGSVSSAFKSLDVLAEIPNDNSVVYPDKNSFGKSLREVAALIRRDVGVRIVAINLGGWDHHTNLTARMEGRGEMLSSALKAFRQDIGEDFGRTLLLGMTEFGRTVKENGNDGTDHGHGSMMFGMGGSLVGAGGGKVTLANDEWIGLKKERLNRDRYLQVTTDFRDVFAEVLDKHMNLGGSFGSILPGHSVDTRNYPGLI